MSDEYTDRKFVFIDDEGTIRLAQVKSMTMAKANRQEVDRVFSQLLRGERRVVQVVTCVGWKHPTGKFSS